jgi:hypothetical protein
MKQHRYTSFLCGIIFLSVPFLLTQIREKLTPHCEGFFSGLCDLYRSDDIYLKEGFFWCLSIFFVFLAFKRYFIKTISFYSIFFSVVAVYLSFTVSLIFPLWLSYLLIQVLYIVSEFSFNPTLIGKYSRNFRILMYFVYGVISLAIILLVRNIFG